MLVSIMFAIGMLFGSVLAQIFNLLDYFTRRKSRPCNYHRLEQAHKDKVTYIFDNTKYRLSQFIINTKPDFENFKDYFDIECAVSDDMRKYLESIPQDKFIGSFEKYLDFLIMVVASNKDPNYKNVARWKIGLFTGIRGVE